MEIGVDADVAVEVFFAQAGIATRAFEKEAPAQAVSTGVFERIVNYRAGIDEDILQVPIHLIRTVEACFSTETCRVIAANKSPAGIIKAFPIGGGPVDGDAVLPDGWDGVEGVDAACGPVNVFERKCHINRAYTTKVAYSVKSC